MARTAITPTRDENFPDWYQEVIRQADLAENSPVRGCMVIKPYGYAIWEHLKRELDQRIKDHGALNAYFPLLIPLSFLSKEAEHVDGFATECAVVTHHRLEADEDGDTPGALKPAAPLHEPLIVRPTSETMIGEVVKDWIQSYRDLPMKINQWANVMRWELRPRLFLRTSEFLWQEGHCFFRDQAAAEENALEMINVYQDLAENVLCLPVIKGVKTAEERFPGAIDTYTIEAMMQDGKALQAGTSHYLGQTFTRSAGITYQSEEGVEEFAHSTSWGVSTRMIGGVIMGHGDDDGLILPPAVAPYQVVIIPIEKKDTDRDRIFSYIDRVSRQLQDAGISVKVDDGHDGIGTKIWNWVKKGAPIRLEIGPMEVDDQQVTMTRRDTGKSGKKELSINGLEKQIEAELNELSAHLLTTARQKMMDRVIELDTVDDLDDYYTNGGDGWAKMPATVLDNDRLGEIYDAHALSSRCLPLADDGQTVLIGKSY